MSRKSRSTKNISTVGKLRFIRHKNVANNNKKPPSFSKYSKTSSKFYLSRRSKT